MRATIYTRHPLLSLLFPNLSISLLIDYSHRFVHPSSCLINSPISSLLSSLISFPLISSQLISFISFMRSIYFLSLSSLILPLLLLFFLPLLLHLPLLLLLLYLLLLLFLLLLLLLLLTWPRTMPFHKVLSAIMRAPSVNKQKESSYLSSFLFSWSSSCASSIFPSISFFLSVPFLSWSLFFSSLLLLILCLSPFLLTSNMSDDLSPKIVCKYLMYDFLSASMKALADL